MHRRFLLALALVAGPVGASQARPPGTPTAVAAAPAPTAAHAPVELALGPAATLQAEPRPRPAPAASRPEDGTPGNAGRLLAALALMAAIALRRWMPGAS